MSLYPPHRIAPISYKAFYEVYASLLTLIINTLKQIFNVWYHMKRLPSRYLKVKKGSDGYKKGIRYIDFGKNESSPTRMLKHRPKLHKRA